MTDPLSVCDYTHLNPVRAKLIVEEEKLETYAWSSYPDYLKAPRERPKWLRTDRLLGEHGITRDNPQGRREFSRRMEQRRANEDADGVYSGIRRGWLGAEDFMDRLRDKIKVAERNRHEASQVRETMRSRAMRMIEEELAITGLKVEDLTSLPKGAPIKVRIARKLRKETTLTLKEVASLLHGGNWRSLANALSKNVSI